MKDIEFTYLVQPPKRYTFEQPKVKEYVEANCNGKVLNLFAGKVRLNADEVRVDLSDEFNPDYCMDAFEFCKYACENGMVFDTIILDPPYSYRKSMEKYNGKTCSSFVKVKDMIPKILSDGGTVITFGYSSSSMGKVRNFIKVGVCLICHNGAHHDTICLVERYCR